MTTNDPHAVPVPDRGGAYAYNGTIHWEYSPDLDGEPDPGEIVWTWVSYEEDASIGKDRPVAVVGRADDGRLVLLMLSSKDHDDDRNWIAIGSGPWDRDGRASWLRRDRVLAAPSEAVRREGAVMPRPTYDRVVAAMGGSTIPTPNSLPAAQPGTTAPHTSGFRGALHRLFRRSG